MIAGSNAITLDGRRANLGLHQPMIEAGAGILSPYGNHTQ
jgi:hypothetical protein